MGREQEGERYLYVDNHKILKNKRQNRQKGQKRQKHQSQLGYENLCNRPKLWLFPDGCPLGELFLVLMPPRLLMRSAPPLCRAIVFYY